MLFYIIAFSIIAGLFIIAIILYFVSLQIISKMIMKKLFDHRYDVDPDIKLFVAEDFDGLKTEAIEFKNAEGALLNGFIYSSEKNSECKALVVLSHGLGPGHQQYTSEINYFVKNGYKVFAYDNAGCNLSEGSNIVCLSHGTVDLKSALEYIKTIETINSLPILLYGHSMGAFAVSNIFSIYSDESIKGVVALAPFVEEVEFLFDNIKNYTRSKLEKKMIFRKLKKRMGKNVGLNTIKSISSCEVPYFLITGDRDGVVDYEKNFVRIKNALAERKNFEYLIVTDRYHRPNISVLAAQYDQVTKTGKRKVDPQLTTNDTDEIDFKLLTEFDDKVMSKISDFYSDCISKEL